MSITTDPIKVIPRSKPAWVPKPGEPVFTINHDYTLVRFGKVASIQRGDNEITVDVMFPQGGGKYTLDHVKPGQIAYIGKPWSEIPDTQE